MSGKYALIIGNTEYIDSNLQKISAPGKDAESLAQALENKDIGAFSEVKVLLNENSFKVVEALEDFSIEKNKDDMLVLYFSGHGVTDDTGSLYLTTKNTKLSRLLSTSIHSEYIRKVMDNSPSRRQILILDCCYSGAFLRGAKKAVTGTKVGTGSVFSRSLGYGRVILTASDSTQLAFGGNGILGKTENSVFTHYLVEGLEGAADFNNDGEITVDKLYDYVSKKIKEEGLDQRPLIFSTKEEGELILAELPYSKRVPNVPLPESVEKATKEDQPTFIRLASVDRLAVFLKDEDPGLAFSARLKLEQMAGNDDSQKVKDAAKIALTSAPDPRKKNEAPLLVRKTKLADFKEKFKSFIEATQLFLKKQSIKKALIYTLLSIIVLIVIAFPLRILVTEPPRIVDTYSILNLYASNSTSILGSTTIFYNEDDVYLHISLENVSPGTPIKAQWYYRIDIFEDTYLLTAITTYTTVFGDDRIYFYVKNPILKGNYRVEVYVDNRLAGIGYFAIK